MAKLKGVLQFTGKLGGLSYYQLHGKNVVRQTGGFDGEKIRNDDNYANVRKNASEFGRCSKFGKKLRVALHPFVKELNDPLLHGRMAKMLHAVMKLDLISEKGNRSVALGLQHAESSGILRGFVWNIADGKRCRYDFKERKLFFDRIPAGSVKAQITLRFIHADEAQDSPDYVQAVYEVVLPRSEFLIPAQEEFGAGDEDSLKFAIIQFFEANGSMLLGKTTVEIG